MDEGAQGGEGAPEGVGDPAREKREENPREGLRAEAPRELPALELGGGHGADEGIGDEAVGAIQPHDEEQERAGRGGQTPP